MHSRVKARDTRACFTLEFLRLTRLRILLCKFGFDAVSLTNTSSFTALQQPQQHKST